MLSTTRLSRSCLRWGKRSYTMALAREIPDSFDDALVAHHQHEEDASFSLSLAREQHASYIQSLREILPVLELPALEDHPDCVFVEDTVVAIGDTAVLTQPGHPSRRGEVPSIGTALHQLGMKHAVIMSGDAYCDGGDVMWTGKDLFVGLSNRTNSTGARVLQDVFQDKNVVVVPPTMQGNQVLHLKSAVTHLNEDTLVVPLGEAGDAVLESLRTSPASDYSVVRIPDVLTCNVVSVNGTVLVQDTKCEESRRVMEAAVLERDMNLVWVDTAELAKKDAALTCCSVLLDV